RCQDTDRPADRRSRHQRERESRPHRENRGESELGPLREVGFIVIHELGEILKPLQGVTCTLKARESVRVLGTETRKMHTVEAANCHALAPGNNTNVSSGATGVTEVSRSLRTGALNLAV